MLVNNSFDTKVQTSGAAMTGTTYPLRGIRHQFLNLVLSLFVKEDFSMVMDSRLGSLLAVRIFGSSRLNTSYLNCARIQKI